MNRNVFLLYLRNLRDLEFARELIKHIHNNEASTYETKHAELTEPHLVAVPDKISWSSGCILGILISFGMAIFVMIGGMIQIPTGLSGDGIHFDTERNAVVSNVRIAHTSLMEEYPLLIMIGVFFFIALGIYILWRTSRNINNRNEEISIAEEHNAQEQIRVESNKTIDQQLQNTWLNRETFLKQESKNVDKLLDDGYCLNILPNQYRNLASLYYLYDYMSTSQESFKDVLTYTSNGMQAIIEKIGSIISQNQSIIINRRIMEANDLEKIKNNQEMLNNLIDASVNSDTVSQYETILKNYNAANAYFANSSYLVTEPDSLS